MKRYDVFKLKTESTKQNYEITIGGKFATPLNCETTESVEKMWDGVKTAFSETSATLLGNKKEPKM